MTELLAPCTIACDAVPDPAVFWAMVGALGTTVTALVAVIGIFLIYRQVGQIREQSSAHYAEGIKWLTDHFRTEEHFRDLVDSFGEAVSENENDRAFQTLARIAGDMNLATQLVANDFLTTEMVYLIIGKSVTRLLGHLEVFKKDILAKGITEGIISRYPEAYDLMLEMKTLNDQDLERSMAWTREHRND